MRPRQMLALCALGLTLATTASAVAQENAQPTLRAADSPAVARTRAARRKPAKTSVKGATPVAGSYQLVPTHPTGSALARARQNSFGTPDDDRAPSSGSGQIGIGLGGGNGTTPGVAFGF